MTNALGCLNYCDVQADTGFPYESEGNYTLKAKFNGRWVVLETFEQGGNVWFNLEGVPQGYLLEFDLFDPSGVSVGFVTFSVNFQAWT